MGRIFQDPYYYPIYLQPTKEFKDKYRKRSGIETTDSELAKLGLKKSRVRELKSVTHKVKLKALALNCRRSMRL
ncbi:MAG: transposase [Deltaproteobacteria bacterium]|jgi:hypothetical protein|nr:transposase [Deltaproteobacteria bacterium]